jgi:hypothetical protein
MSDANAKLCSGRATLLVTSSPPGTSTNVARERILLSCSLPVGHAGAHVDAVHAEQWEGPAAANPTLVRDEDE